MLDTKTFYFDSAATTPIDSKVAKLMHKVNSSYFGNPSSIHQLGQKSHNIIEKARKSIAKNLNCKDSEIYFTSGGSESNNIVLKGTLKSGDHFITSSYEHPSIDKLIEYLRNNNVEVTLVKPNKDGIIDTKDLINKLQDNTKLISIMYVNNEIGGINPIEEIGTILANKNILFHSDAVQYLGKKKLNLSIVPINLQISVSRLSFIIATSIFIIYLLPNNNVPILMWVAPSIKAFL